MDFIRDTSLDYQRWLASVRRCTNGHTHRNKKPTWHFCVCICSVRRLLIASFTVQPHTSSASVPNPWNIPPQSKRSHFVTDKCFPGTARHRFLRLSSSLSLSNGLIEQLHTSTFREQYRSSTQLGLLGRCCERAATRSHLANHCTACSKYWTVHASTLFPEKLRTCLSRASRANHRLGSVTLFTALLLDILPG